MVKVAPPEYQPSKFHKQKCKILLTYVKSLNNQHDICYLTNLHLVQKKKQKTVGWQSHDMSPRPPNLKPQNIDLLDRILKLKI